MKTNQQFAKIFAEFAELLELKGEILFKIIAYQKASRVIDDLSEPVSEIYSEGGIKALEKISGVGEGIAEKIEEYIKTGKIKELEELRGDFPREEIEFLKIPGVGPATAKILFKEFGNISIAQLETKLTKNGKNVFKDKSLKKILKGIEIYKNLGGRMLITEASELADPLVKFLTQKCEARKVVAVGSLRRHKETVGDIDIVATSLNPAETINKFEYYPDFAHIIGKGPTKLSGVLNNGREVDLEILPFDEYGSLLLHFTGSKEHNVALRTFAQRKHLSVSEHGIKNEITGKVILCPEEKDVYENLGLDFIEPELRENRGEVVAALEHGLPKLVELGDIKGDLHLHSNYSDGLNSVEEMTKKAIELKYEYIAFSDHTKSLGIARGLDQKEFLKRRKEINRIQKKFSQIKIFDACEVNILADGSLDLPDEFLESFDLVIGSVHGKFDQSSEEMTQRIIKAILHPSIKIIGHPTGRILNKRPAYNADWVRIFQTAARKKVALEINAYPNRLDLSDGLIFDSREYGPLFAINTDSHQTNQLEYLKYGVWIARRGWLNKQMIINTLSLAELRKWLNS